MNNFIELKNLSKNYKSQKKLSVLKNLNYRFLKGKIYSLVGPSGSGKSTLLNILSLIDRPSKGNIVIQKLIKGEKISMEDSGLSKREWNELMTSFNLREQILS